MSGNHTAQSYVLPKVSTSADSYPLTNVEPQLESGDSSPFPASVTTLGLYLIGVRPEHVDAVLNSAPRTVSQGIQDAKHAAVLSYTDAMTLDVSVPDEVFAKLKKHFSEQEVVEITATVAAYNCVSRFLVALDVGETNNQKGPEKEWEL